MYVHVQHPWLYRAPHVLSFTEMQLVWQRVRFYYKRTVISTQPNMEHLLHSFELTGTIVRRLHALIIGMNVMVILDLISLCVCVLCIKAQIYSYTRINLLISGAEDSTVF